MINPPVIVITPPGLSEKAKAAFEKQFKQLGCYCNCGECEINDEQ